MNNMKNVAKVILEPEQGPELEQELQIVQRIKNYLLKINKN